MRITLHPQSLSVSCELFTGGIIGWYFFRNNKINRTRKHMVLEKQDSATYTNSIHIIKNNIKPKGLKQQQ